MGRVSTGPHPQVGTAPPSPRSSLCRYDDVNECFWHADGVKSMLPPGIMPMAAWRVTSGEVSVYDAALLRRWCSRADLCRSRSRRLHLRKTYRERRGGTFTPFSADAPPLPQPLHPTPPPPAPPLQVFTFYAIELHLCIAIAFAGPTSFDTITF